MRKPPKQRKVGDGPTSVAPSPDIKSTPEFKAVVRLIGSNLRVRRLALELTMEQAAERMNLDVAHVARIETGKLNPTVKTLLRISQGLNCQVVDLFMPPESEPK